MGQGKDYALVTPTATPVIQLQPYSWDINAVYISSILFGLDVLLTSFFGTQVIDMLKWAFDILRWVLGLNMSAADFRDAAESGNLDEVQRYIDENPGNHANLDLRDNDGSTALMLAADRGHIDVVNALIAAHANLDLRDNDGSTALIWAVWGARNGRIDIVNALIAAHANLDLRDNAGYTALMSAARNSRHIDVVNALITANANLDLQSNAGSTALMWAAHNGRIDIVNALIAAHANLDLRDNDGYTALMRAARDGHIDIVNALIAAHANLALTNNNGQTAADVAEQHGHPVLAATLRANMDNAGAVLKVKKIENLVYTGEYEAAIEIAVKAQSEGDPEILWNLAEKLYESIGPEEKEENPRVRKKRPDLNLVFRCYELVSPEHPRFYANSCSRRAELMELAELAEDKDSLEYDPAKRKALLEERLRLALAGFKENTAGVLYAEAAYAEIAHMIADRVYHAMQEKPLAPEVNIKGDTAQILAFIASQSMQIESLAKLVTEQQQTIADLNSEIQALKSSAKPTVMKEYRKEKNSDDMVYASAPNILFANRQIASQSKPENLFQRSNSFSN